MSRGLLPVQTYLQDGDPAGLTIDPRNPGLSPDPRTVQRVLDDLVVRPRLPGMYFPDGPVSTTGMKRRLIAQGGVLFLRSIVGPSIAVAGSIRVVRALPDRGAGA